MVEKKRFLDSPKVILQARAVFHGVADVATLGLWEVIGTPTEVILSGDEVAFEVSYDENNRIEQVIALKKR